MTINKNFLLLFLVLFFYWFGVLLYDLIDKYLSFSLMDELLVLLLAGVYFIFGLFRKWSINKSFLIFIVLSILYLLYSFIIESNHQIAIVSDYLVFIKSFLVYFMILELRVNFSNRDKKILRLHALLGVFLLPVIFLSGVHPSRYATAAVASAFLFFYASSFSQKNVFIFIFMMALGLLSERSKMYGFFALSSIIVLYFYHTRQQLFIYQKKHLLYTFLLLCVAVLVSYEKIYFYFYKGSFLTENLFARPLLFITSFQIALDYFPFGSGFASFGSYFSAVYYSDIYYQYNLYWQQGFSPEGVHGGDFFIVDSFFPQILGQFGFVGLVLFLGSGYALLKEAYRQQKQYLNLKRHFFIVLTIILFFVIESIADSTLTHNRGAFMILILALTISEMRQLQSERHS